MASDLIEEHADDRAGRVEQRAARVTGLMEESDLMAQTTRSEDACAWSREVESSSMETLTGG